MRRRARESRVLCFGEVGVVSNELGGRIGDSGSHASSEREGAVIRLDAGAAVKGRDVGTMAAGAACVARKDWGRRSKG